MRPRADGFTLGAPPSGSGHCEVRPRADGFTSVARPDGVGQGQSATASRRFHFGRTGRGKHLEAVLGEPLLESVHRPYQEITHFVEGARHFGGRHTRRRVRGPLVLVHAQLRLQRLHLGIVTAAEQIEVQSQVSAARRYPTGRRRRMVDALRLRTGQVLLVVALQDVHLDAQRFAYLRPQFANTQG